MSEVIASAPVPRPIDKRARRRAWADPHVRAWWVSAAILAVIAISLGIQEFSEWNTLRRAITSGVSVPATIIQVNDNNRAHTPVSRDDPVIVQYAYNGQGYSQLGTLSGLERNNIFVGDSVPIQIDPADPANWSAEHELRPLSPEMIGPGLLVFAGCGAMLFAWLGHRSVLRTYSRGSRVLATVTSNKQTPIAPRCRSVGAAVPPGGRVVDVFVPPSLAAVAPGDSIELLLPPGSGRVLAAAWMPGFAS